MTGVALPTPTLFTARLRLRPFGDADSGGLFALHSSAYVLRYWDAPPWTDRGRAGGFIASCRQLEREGTLREDCVVNGDVSDSWVYGLLRREWRARPERTPVI